MMKSPIFVGIAAGLASALLYGSIASGTVMAALLFYFASLPLFIAGLGWGIGSVALAAGIAALSGAIIAGFKFAGLYLLWAGLPAIVLVYLANLSRVADQGADPQEAAQASQERDGPPAPAMEWYPPGRLLAWICIGAAVLMFVTILVGGPGIEAFRDNLRKLFQTLIERSPDFKQALNQIQGTNPQQAVTFMVSIIPPLSAALWTATIFAMLWIGAITARASGRLRRPWPDLHDITVPFSFAIAFAVSLAVALLAGGLTGAIAMAFAAAGSVAFTIIGLTVVYVATRANPFRPVVMAIAYLLLLLLPWLAMPIYVAIGLAETGFALKARVMMPPGGTV